MSVRSKKAKRWAKRIEEMTKKRDCELKAKIERIRLEVAHTVEHSNINFKFEAFVEITAQRVNELIVYSPEWLIFREKREAKNCLNGTLK